MNLSGEYCGLCKNNDNLTITECCRNFICNEFDDGCLKEHLNETVCGMHYINKHEGKWQECIKCQNNLGNELFNFHGINGSNFERLSEHLPFEKTRCCKCTRRIFLALEDYHRENKIFTCINCHKNLDYPIEHYEDIDKISNKEIAQIIHQFNSVSDIPYKAINRAIELQHEITPILLSHISNMVKNHKDIDFERKDYIVSLYLLAKFREAKAFELLIKILNFSDGWLEDLFGDIYGSNIHKLLISTFNGDFNLLKKIIENNHIDIWIRTEALDCLPGLFILNKITRQQAIEYLGELLNSDYCEDNDFLMEVVEQIIEFYPDELLPQINTIAQDDNKLDMYVMDKLEEAINFGREKCLKENIYENDHYHAIDHVIDSIHDYYEIESPEEVDPYLLFGEVDIVDLIMVLNSFDDKDQEVPINAINRAIELKAEFTPHLLSLVKNIVKHHELIDQDRLDYLISLYLLAHFKEQRAFEYIVQIASFDQKWVEDFFGNNINRSLPRILFSTFNGNLDILKKLVVNENAHFLCRQAALDCMLGLAVSNNHHKEEIIRFYSDLLDSKFINNDMFQAQLIKNCILINSEELIIKATPLIEKDYKYGDLNRKTLKMVTGSTKIEWDRELEVYVNQLSINNLVEEIDGYYRGAKEDNDVCYNRDCKVHYATEQKYIQVPFVRLEPKIGRNDLCPCNSQKKYKKCCMIN